MSTTPDMQFPYNHPINNYPEWPKRQPIHLPDFIQKYPSTNQHYASIFFKSCAIDDTGVKEILLVNRQQCHNPLMLLEIPLPTWQKENMLEHMELCLPWQPDFGPFPYHTLLRQDDLIYNEPALICPGQAVIGDGPPIFRPYSERASHILIKCTWQVPSSTEDTEPQTAYKHEQKAGRFSDDYIDSMMEHHGALLYRRAASNFYPYGADYWIFPLSQTNI